MVVPGVGTVAALFAHSGVGRTIVSALKHRDDRAVAAWLGEGLASLPTAAGRVDVVTWVPASTLRVRQRGHDTGQMLAREVGRRIEASVGGLLVRAAGPAQTGRRRADRLAGPTLRLDPTAAARWLRLPQDHQHRRGRQGCGPRVLVVDDVVTTGASMAAAAAVLRPAGAVSVSAAAVAIRPFEGRSPGHYNHRTHHE